MPPTPDELNSGQSLDELTARKHFLGLTVEQAEQLFHENSLYYQEDLLYMKPMAFCYYVESLLRYMASPSANQDADIVSCFAGVLEFRLKHATGPEDFKPIAPRLTVFFADLLERWERFEVDQTIYGDVQSRYVALRSCFSQMAGSP